jgi:hypothetical protein
MRDRGVTADRGPTTADQGPTTADQGPTTADPGAARLRVAEEALHKVQAQAAALEELSEQLSLSVHVLEAEVGALGEELRSRPPAHAAGVAAGTASGALADVAPAAVPAKPPRSTDVDGARLVALDMALAGAPREDAERYVAEHFDVPDPERLLDEVYAAVR